MIDFYESIVQLKSELLAIVALLLFGFQTVTSYIDHKTVLINENFEITVFLSVLSQAEQQKITKKKKRRKEKINKFLSRLSGEKQEEQQLFGGGCDHLKCRRRAW